VTDSSAPRPLNKWRYGIHPQAAGTRLDAIGRVELALGEALRLEMVDERPDAADLVHVQYYIATESGGWALWISCPKADLPAREATLQDLTPPESDSP
jgi:hypothetical protein